MDYVFEKYANLDQLKKADPKLADELAKKILNEGERIQGFMVFPNKVEFAKHEVDFRLEVIDWGSGIDPLEYIDFAKLADDLITEWNSPVYYVSDKGKIVRRSY